MSDQVLCLSDLEYLSLVATFASHFATPLESASKNLRKALWNLNVTSLILNQSERLKLFFIFAFDVVYLQLHDVIT